MFHSSNLSLAFLPAVWRVSRPSSTDWGRPRKCQQRMATRDMVRRVEMAPKMERLLAIVLFLLVVGCWLFVCGVGSGGGSLGDYLIK